jgi:hypothetical protein
VQQPVHEPLLAAEPAPETEPVVVDAPVAVPPIVPPAAVEPVAVGKPYLVNVRTSPAGARVTASGQSCTAPCTLHFDALPTPVVVDATLPNHSPTTATVDALADFKERASSFYRTLFLKLNPERTAISRPTPPRPPSPTANSEPAAVEPANDPPAAAPAPAPAPVPAPEPVIEPAAPAEPQP